MGAIYTYCTRCERVTLHEERSRFIDPTCLVCICIAGEDYDLGFEGIKPDPDIQAKAEVHGEIEKGY